jgi:imidazolonepropionase-like amidohydrolase
VSSLLVSGATIIDGAADKPVEGQSIWIEKGRIKAIGGGDELGAPPGANVVDARGKYAVPGLMNANVHLFSATSLERLARHLGHYEEIIVEAAQVALKNGLTTVFDTWGPRRFLMAARDRIDAGRACGSRIFCAGNIIGFDGPFSPDFFGKVPEVASAALVNRVNAIWVENVGRHLMWLTPEHVAKEVRTYIGKGIDFIKYASNEHGAHAAGAFLQFSPQTQEAIVKEAHCAGLSAQAHCMTVEGLRIAIEAGCDLITHCNITGPTPIPEATLDLFVKRNVGAVVFPFTQRRLEWFFEATRRGVLGTESAHTMYRAADTNVRSLVRCGATLLLANDAYVWAPELATDPAYCQWAGLDMDNYLDLSEGHFFWFKAMEEKGCAPMEMLRAATRNIAVAYGKDKDLGTLQPGKIADILILDKNPLQAAENYRSIHMILKEGAVVSREVLPTNPIMTKPIDPPAEEEAAYFPALASGRFPLCPMCTSR